MRCQSFFETGSGDKTGSGELSAFANMFSTAPRLRDRSVAMRDARSQRVGGAAGDMCKIARVVRFVVGIAILM